MYNKKGPAGKGFMKVTKANVKKDRAIDKKRAIKESSKKDKVLDFKKFGKKV